MLIVKSNEGRAWRRKTEILSDVASSHQNVSVPISIIHDTSQILDVEVQEGALGPLTRKK